MLSDEDLAVRVQQGDQESLEILVKRYHGPIYSYIYRMIGEYHTVVDIVQDVFIKMCKNIGMYNSEMAFKPWLYAIASNTCKDYYKKAYVQKVTAVADVPEDETHEDTTPEDIVLDTMKKHEIRDVVAGLNEIYRDVVVLRFYQDLKLDEIASILQIPTGTVKSRLFAGLKQLKKLFAEKGWG